uniref:RNA polymerase beta subunit n=1 Tax=Spiraea japonica TaxID=309823 RepID=A0A8K1JAR9_9ROSA|nr:RNA polymerase beta subunit [Spiraea japonica]
MKNEQIMGFLSLNGKLKKNAWGWK